MSAIKTQMAGREVLLATELSAGERQTAVYKSVDDLDLIAYFLRKTVSSKNSCDLQDDLTPV